MVKSVDMQISVAVQKQLIQFLRRRFPRLLAVYIYGSRAQGTARPDSDLDLAILIEGYLPPAELWETGHLLAEITNCDVDPVDFRASPTVLQSQILRSGTRIWLKDYHVEIYEAAILTQKTHLDEARRGLLDDISRTGSVYGG